jgi:hypothetical protein
MVSLTPCLLYHQERAPGTDRIGGLMGLKASLDVVEKSRQCAYNIILWGVCETYVAVEIRDIYSLCVVG